MAQFKSWNAFAKFQHEVSRERRYVRTSEADDFLRTVAVTCKSRLRPMPKGRIFWRARLGNEWDKPHGDNNFSVAVAYSSKEMKPLRDSAFEGRANPKGIPCLYVSTTAHAAMSEVRPWIGAMVSVAQFETIRPLTVVDCSVHHDKFFSMAYLDRDMTRPIPDEKIDDIVWAAIDSAFAEPVTRTDDVAEYAPTQVIADLFRHEGYDGVAYKSAFGEDAFNIALFDLDSAVQLNGMLYDTKTVDFKFEEGGPPYFLKRDTESG